MLEQQEIHGKTHEMRAVARQLINEALLPSNIKSSAKRNKSEAELLINEAMPLVGKDKPVSQSLPASIEGGGVTAAGEDKSYLTDSSAVAQSVPAVVDSKTKSLAKLLKDGATVEAIEPAWGDGTRVKGGVDITIRDMNGNTKQRYNRHELIKMIRQELSCYQSASDMNT